jgi:threonine dehydrogenase-like Zn-dependent dehydrogenase
MEAHGSPAAALAQRVTSHLPDAVTEPLLKKAGLDRLAALYTAIETVRRGGTVSLSGVYGGMADPMPMMSLFDKQIQLRMGQANVKRWIPDIMPFLTDEDPLGIEEFATHRLPLHQAPEAYEMFQRKADGAIKIMLKPWA